MPSTDSGKKPVGSSPPSGRVALAMSVWVTLLVFWLLLSGIYTAFLVAAGMGCAAGVVALAIRMGLIDVEGHPIRYALRAILWYWPWLIKEIVKSAWQVSIAILHPKLPISPQLVRFKPSQRSEVGLVIHANSITLTPGTMCIEARPDEFLVHAVNEKTAAGVGTGSEIDRRVARMEGFL